MAATFSLIISVLRKFWTRLNESGLQKLEGLNSSGSRDLIDIRRLTAPSRSVHLPTIEYAYDPLSGLHNLRQPSYRLPHGTTARKGHLSLNSVELDPLAAGLPYRCSIRHVRASRFWKANLDETVTLLKLLASDKCAADIEVDHGITVAKIAEKSLRPGFEHQMVLAAHYMFPGADEQRIKYIAALMILYFVFDDKVEETPDRTLHVFRNDFLRRLEGRQSHESSPSALQSHIDDIVHGIESEDAAGGDGGKEMLSALRDAFRCVHPPSGGFHNVDDYLCFRRFNVGAAFVIAAAKFSIKSSVCLTDQRFSRYFSLVGDHLGLVNDVASYDKELRALDTGETSDMINLVAVMKSVTSLKGTEEAKGVAWALQLQIEQQMLEELERLHTQGLSSEEYWFLEAVASTAVGNVMFCMTTSRYGGEAARIRGRRDSIEKSG